METSPVKESKIVEKIENNKDKKKNNEKGNIDFLTTPSFNPFQVLNMFQSAISKCCEGFPQMFLPI